LDIISLKIFILIWNFHKNYFKLNFMEYKPNNFIFILHLPLFIENFIQIRIL
jgi:hypothetical protein